MAKVIELLKKLGNKLNISIVPTSIYGGPNKHQMRPKELANFYEARNRFIDTLRENDIHAEMKDENIHMDEYLIEVLKQHPNQFDVLINLGCNRIDMVAATNDFDGPSGLYLLASLLKPTTKLYVMEEGNFIDNIDFKKFSAPFRMIFSGAKVPLIEYIQVFNDCFEVVTDNPPPYFQLRENPHKNKKKFENLFAEEMNVPVPRYLCT